MKEESKNEKSRKHKHKKDKKKKHKKRSSSSSSSSSEKWVEKQTSVNTTAHERDDWMSMTGMLKTYSKDDIKAKREEKTDKNRLDSYNPATSVRELNPYWKNGGMGLPETSQNLKKKYLVPDDDDDDYYSKPSSSKGYESSKTSHSSYSKSTSSKCEQTNKYEYSKTERETSKSYNWKKYADKDSPSKKVVEVTKQQPIPTHTITSSNVAEKSKSTSELYMSDEKLNKLAAKVVKAEIMGDTKLVQELKAKLDAAREYRKQNPNAGKEDEDDRVMLMSTNSMGQSRPLTNTVKGDPKSRSGKRKADTHMHGERAKYFGNDDKYNLSQMFEEEKYGNNYNEEAQLAKIASKHKNPNDDLEDIFMDDISKNRNDAKDQEMEKQRAIQQHTKLERSLEGCEFCLDSKSMIKHLMVSCGNKVYIALPSKQSLVKGHCIITTIQHNTCVTMLDEDVWEEVLTYRRALTQLFNSQYMDVVFFETATKLHRYPHMVINCIPLPRDVGDTAAIYFQKALLECEAEWSMNKKVVNLKGKNIRKGIPKGLPYFWIDFGMDPGFAHVIEDQQLFPKTFAEEIIGGMLDLDHRLWKNPRKEYGDIQRKKVLEFTKEWKPFEPNKN